MSNRQILVRDLKAGDVVEIKTTYRIVDMTAEEISTVKTGKGIKVYKIVANFEERPFDPSGVGFAEADDKVHLISRVNRWEIKRIWSSLKKYFNR